ncbi:phosphonate ABC transporter substrate-binding protein [Pantoea endophytica]|uniref:phosphonate ABC transporter substrate-binding protein n=1 Tax=Pantoea endophytica TaxID=92488 RepID=UPI0024131403|nr:phosphonate ABC transporter substrate-binding protein [Pantoea endophytica]
MRVIFIILGCCVTGILGLFALIYIDVELGYQADLKACPKVTPQQVVAAVVQDVTRRDSHTFGRFNLSADDVYIVQDEVQIGPTIAGVPFRIKANPDREYFAMPRCSDLSDIEYGG